MTTAQYLVDNCEKHGKIVWKELKEKVNRDRVQCTKLGQYKEWPSYSNLIKLRKEKYKYG